MSIEIAFWTLLHMLVLVYWLGGDLGAFYTSRYLTDPGIHPDRRLMAAGIVGDVDMAPRTALILALPTGYMLAVTTGWLSAPIWTAWGVLLAGLVWLGIAWRLHLAHGRAPVWLKTVDLGLRWVLLASLAASGVAALSGVIDMPAFIALKCLCLSAAIGMGLMIRRVLSPLGSALVGLQSAEPAAAEAKLAQTLRRARPLVLVIWALILAAACFGLLKPEIY
jgi:hypothetical protein